MPDGQSLNISVQTETSCQVKDVRFQTEDEFELSGNLYVPSSPIRYAMVLHGGVGFSAKFYADFANWLSSTHDVAVLTYDYRDYGQSLNRPLTQSKALVSDWGIKDQSAALSYVLREFPHVPVRVLGHSLGGQWLAFHREIARVDRVVTVASGPGYWLQYPWAALPAIIMFWWLLGPLAVTFSGYMPGRKLGMGADIPASAYWEWRKLCLRRDLHRSEWGRTYPQPRLEDARFQLTSFPIADDTIIPPNLVRRLPMFYPHATVSERLIDPREFGVKGLGHGGVFLKRNREFWGLVMASLVEG